MSPRVVPSATPLGRPVDLGASWNADDGAVARALHPRYRPALRRVPAGPSVFRGLPFELGSRSAGRRWFLLDHPERQVAVDLRPEDATGASHLVVAHFSDSWRNENGERPPGMPVGWVLPAGEPLATYELALADGGTRTITVRRRFEIDDGIIGWGFLPFEAVSHQADATLDWRGPHPRQAAGRYAPAGHAGPLTMLPGAWGPDLTGVADFVPTPDDDIALWLHAIPLGGAERPVSIRLASLGGGRPGTAVIVAGLTLFHGTSSPLVQPPRRQLRIEGASGLPSVDLGVAIRALPPVEPRPAAGDDSPVGWGASRAPATPAPLAAIVDLTATADARIGIDGWDLPIAELDRDGTATRGAVVVRALPPVDVRVAVRVLADDEPSPARVRFVAADGRYLPPLGHRDEINPGLMEDTGADIVLGGDAFAYVPGEFAIDLPAGRVEVEVVKGFEQRPIRRTIEVGPSTRALELRLDRALDTRRDRWTTSDSHVHFLSPSTALLQAAAEDVDTVHVLGTQWGDVYTSTQDAPWGAAQDPTGRHAVLVGTENRQNLLGHLALLGARRPVLPMASGGGPEGRLGGGVELLLADWADECHAAGGLVVGAHFPLPFAEIASAIVTGRIDAVEMQCFAPGLDTPSILEWYRFLNCGYRLPVVGGTDKMSAEVPVGAIRTYARLHPGAMPGFDAWSAAVRAGRTFATSGPVVELEVDGHQPGDVVALPASGATLAVRVRASAAQAVIGAVELVVNGRVVAGEVPADPVTDLAFETAVVVREGSWIAARSRSNHEIQSAFTTTMAAHTSPVYVEVPDRPLFVPDDAEAIATVVDGTARWLEVMAAVADPVLRGRMVDQIAAAAQTLRGRIASQAGGGRR